MHDMHEQQGRVSVNCIVTQRYLFCVCWKLSNKVNINICMAHLTEMGDTYERSKILLRETCVGNLATI